MFFLHTTKILVKPLQIVVPLTIGFFSTFLANNPSILPPSIFLLKYFSKARRNTKGLYEIGGKKLGYNFYTYTYGRFKI